MTTDLNQRRHDLDWLRVIAFSLLIFYHVGMYYVSWGWHVKSPYSGEFLEPIMQLLNPWRLSLLFVISGVAFRFASDKFSRSTMAKLRTRRLLIPLLFGSLVIVAPQTYFELLANGVITPGYGPFYLGYLNTNMHQYGEVITPTYNHLWFVLYLLLYSLLLLPFLNFFKAFNPGDQFRHLIDSALVLIIPVIPFLIIRFTPFISAGESHIVWDDTGAHIRYFSYFLTGILISKSPSFWSAIARYRKHSIWLVLVSASILSVLWANWTVASEDMTVVTFARALRIFYIWWVMCALFGLAQHYLNKSSERLGYLTEAVFPYYILHQTVIILVGAFLSQYLLGGFLEFVLLTLSTVAVCGLLHEYLIRRHGIFRLLFGMKPLTKKAEVNGLQAEWDDTS